MDQKKLYQNLLDLCEVDSSTPSGEEAIAALLAKKLAQIPYFHSFPGQMALHGPNRQGGLFVHAFMKCQKETKQTILLLSHLDTVGVDDWGAARHLAFSPTAYTDYLKENPASLSSPVKEDLFSGDYLFGRGVCDMKWGIAAHLEILHHFSACPQKLEANLLFLCVSDEEGNSAGMLDAIAFLLSLREKEGLMFKACVVSEPPVGTDSPDEVVPLYIGAAGKLMPAFFCLGKETHAGEPFLGLNPHTLTAALITQLENSPEFTDMDKNHSAPPPCCLKQGDLQTQYSVQTPGSAYAYFNKITLNSTPERVLKAMESAAYTCFDQVLEQRREKWRTLEAKSGKGVPFRDFSPRVLTYREVWERARNLHPKIFEQHMEAYLSSLSSKNLQENTILAVREACSFLDDAEPAVVLFFCPPFYPHSHPEVNPRYLLSACDKVVAQAAQWGEPLAVTPYFGGITDMCYLSFLSGADLAPLIANCPLWSKWCGAGPVIGRLSIPFVNLGPKGKDAHQRSERLHLPHALQTAPRLLLLLITQLAEEEII